MELVKVFKEDILLTFISTPPLIGEFLVGTGVVFPSLTRFTNTSRTINPDTTAVRGLTFNSHVILLNAL